MANVTVIGSQWGDEGKGKIVDWLASRADAVVRFQGGHNAGHTLVVGNTTYKLSLLPSGIVTGTLSIIGNGVVLDPWHLKEEIAKLESQGVTINPDNFAIADNCPLILPIHRDLDGLRESAAGAGKIGTTGRGIGPAYEDKVGRRAIRVCDLAHLDHLEPQLDRLCAHHDALRAGFEEPPVDRERLLNDLREIAPSVLQYAQPVWKRLKKVRKACCSTSITGLIRSSPVRTPSAARPRRARGSAPTPPGSCWGSSRPTPPASAAGRSRPNSTTPPGGSSASVATSSAR